ncbi:MAG: helix-turn-helix transcriptional regulator [Armatimonadetes bacterium]|nr:helix-turn-helix transcriptional regulator [Armatimonadota bacterium]MDE2205492.1 helix-turn-helix transcriptional regulator [Armatimonadota bacterium]
MTPATIARMEAGLTIKEASRRARISEGYLRQIERRGASYSVARRLAALYQCRLDVFLPRKEDSKAPF